jgi:hypothetical protein
MVKLLVIVKLYILQKFVQISSFILSSFIPVKKSKGKREQERLTDIWEVYVKALPLLAVFGKR